MSLRTICENESFAVEQYGDVVSRKLKARLADLVVAQNVSEIYVGSPSEIIYHDLNAYKVDLSNGYRIVFTCNHVKKPILQSGSINWNEVSYIKIITIENENE